MRREVTIAFMVDHGFMKQRLTLVISADDADLIRILILKLCAQERFASIALPFT
jgi:hypothetical protein